MIDALEEWVRTKRTRTFRPPAFHERDGTFVIPPPFEMPAYVTQKPEYFTPKTEGEGKVEGKGKDFFTQNIQQNKGKNEPNVKNSE